MWPELKVDQSPVGVAICLERQQGMTNAMKEKIRELHLNSLLLTSYIPNRSQRRGCGMGKGCKDFRTKIMNDPREKTKTRSV